MTPLLEVRDLNAWYGESHVLHGVNMHVSKGETVCILGRNGMGKTTTLRSIMGIVRQRQGRITLGGQDLTALPLHHRAHGPRLRARGARHLRHPVGRGEPASAPVISQGGMTLDEIYRLFPNLLERRRSPGTKLSGGEQQMLAIARILRTGATTLLLDEPTEGLAPVIIDAIGVVLRELRARGMTVVLVEQNFRFASKVADRFYIMDHGQMTHEFPVGELAARMDMLHEALGV